MAVQNILPDPVNTIDEAGQDLSGGVAGPGYKTVKLSSVQDVLTDRSRSGITYRRINQYHQWKIDITYNKLTKTQFDTVYPFLLQRQSFQEAFFVNLPQYNNTGSITSSVPNLSQPAGQHYLTVTNSANVQKGDLLTISDSTDATHKKTYKITAIDSSNHYLYLTPTLQRKVDTTSGATIVFDVVTPKIRVIAVGSTVDYSLDSSGLYSFSVKLEETLS